MGRPREGAGTDLEPVDAAALRRGGRWAWDRLTEEGESVFAYRAFCIYRDMGGSRTVAGAGRVYGDLRREERRKEVEEARAAGREVPRYRGLDSDKASHVGGWSKRWRWAERAGLYDRHMSDARFAAKVRVLETYETRRERERLDAEEVNLAAAQQLQMKAFEMLQWPLEETTTEERTEEGGRVVYVTKVVKPAGWTMKDAARLLAEARRLQVSVFYPRESPQELTVAAVEAAAAAVEATRVPDDEVQAEARRRAEEFRAKMLERVLSMPSMPPQGGEMEPAPQPEESEVTIFGRTGEPIIVIPGGGGVEGVGRG